MGKSRFLTFCMVVVVVLGITMNALTVALIWYQHRHYAEGIITNVEFVNNNITLTIIMKDKIPHNANTTSQVLYIKNSSTDIAIRGRITERNTTHIRFLVTDFNWVNYKRLEGHTVKIMSYNDYRIIKILKNITISFAIAIMTVVPSCIIYQTYRELSSGGE